MPTSIAQGSLSPASSNEETQKLVNLLRAYCADVFRKHYRLTTAASGALQTIWSADLPTSGAWLVKVDVVARSLVGGSARAAFTRLGLFYRDAGAAIQEGAISAPLTIKSVAALDVSLSASGNGARLQVLDDGLRTMSWSALVRVDEI